MKLALVNLTAGSLSGGYRKYLDNLLPLLRDDPHIDDLAVFRPSGVQLQRVEGIRYETWEARPGAAGRTLSAVVQGFHPDAVFVPTARWFPANGIPTVVMLRNMEPLTVPFRVNPPVEALKNRLRAYAAWRACRRADRIIAVSQHVRDVIVDRWRIAPSKVGVVYHGVAPVSSETPEQRPQASQFEGAPFVFTAGSIRPARGLEDLIRAMVPLGRAVPSLRLVVAGAPDAATGRYARSLRTLSVQLGVNRAITWAGQLNAGEMTWCFRRCELFVMTSLAEACPNIALEAMSHGVEVVSVARPPMPEFFEQAAHYYTPGAADELAGRIREALQAPLDDRAARRRHVVARARAFDWRQTARTTVAEIEQAARVSRTGRIC